MPPDDAHLAPPVVAHAAPRRSHNQSDDEPHEYRARRRWGRMVALLLAVIVLGALGGAGIKFVQNGSLHNLLSSLGVSSSTSPQPSSSVSPSASASSSAAPVLTRKQMATQLQQLLQESMKAHQQIAGANGQPAASTRLANCDPTTATAQMDKAAGIRSGILKQLDAMDVKASWPKAKKFADAFRQATETGMKADQQFAQWGRNLVQSCTIATAKNDPAYATASQLAGQFSTERQQAATEWNALVKKFPGLHLTAVDATTL